MSDTLTSAMRLEVVTPSGLVVDEPSVAGVTAPGHLGEFEARPGHQPYLVRLRAGRMAYGSERYAIGGGVAEVGPDRVVVLADTCEHVAAIDTERALRAQERAQQRLAGKGPDAEDTDVARAQAALGRAMARLTVAGS